MNGILMSDLSVAQSKPIAMKQWFIFGEEHVMLTKMSNLSIPFPVLASNTTTMAHLVDISSSLRDSVLAKYPQTLFNATY